MKRYFDLFCLFMIAPFVLPIAILVAISVLLTSGSPVIYWSNRIGVNNSSFRMLKFRTMVLETPAVATHLLSNADNYLTPIGSILRKTSLDELPQLWNIFVGHMSFVGPRPALYNQTDLINLRIKNGVDKLVPGLTGWAQVNGRDDLAIPLKVNYEIEYLKKKSMSFDVKILALTLFKVTLRSGVSH